MFRSQCGYISECQTGEARKQKDVLDKLQPRNIEISVHYSLKLVVCQEYRISLVLFHLISVKRVFRIHSLAIAILVIFFRHFM